MDAKLESIERRAKTLGWDFGEPVFLPPKPKGFLLRQHDIGADHIFFQTDACYTAAERLLALYEAGVVEFELTDAVEMIALGQS